MIVYEIYEIYVDKKDELKIKRRLVDEFLDHDIAVSFSNKCSTLKHESRFIIIPKEED